MKEVIMKDAQEITITNGELNKRLCNSLWAGRAASLEDVAARLASDAGVEFSKGQDEKAKILREISKTLADSAKAERKKQQEFM